MEKYFSSTVLLQNILLPYFYDEEPLKYVNKLFYGLNYEKYNTHLQPHGTKKTYYFETKVIQGRYNYKNGMLDGLFEEWYHTGRLYKRCNYRYGRLNGLYEKWYDTRSDATVGSNGQLFESKRYINNKLDGLYKKYYIDGTLELKVYFKNGKLHGLLEEWYVDGLLHKKINYEYDKKHGLSEIWLINGSYYSKCNYDNDTITKKYH